ncbi:hypothetical protein EYF80_047460 [Liparis tanakae]|uniref:Uncharacterized protein n=1 Tax=Liparis tanakae TaxID=230148 RepID=A0A4Z2FN93_9TELE|nr:hypothetical protein EYF80_047460 [Liparis tanakae]
MGNWSRLRRASAASCEAAPPPAPRRRLDSVFWFWTRLRRDTRLLPRPDSGVAAAAWRWRAYLGGAPWTAS